MDFQKWWQTTIQTCPKDQRLGQWLVNNLRALDSEQAANIPLDVDPYFDNKRINSFQSWLFENW